MYKLYHGNVPKPIQNVHTSNNNVHTHFTFHDFSIESKDMVTFINYTTNMRLGESECSHLVSVS